MMDKKEVADSLREYAVLLELLGEDRFRALAYDNAARQLEACEDPLDVLISQNLLSGIKGIGKSLAAVIAELAATGTFAELEHARERVPSGVRDLLRVEGLGPKKARVLWTQANVTSLEELDAALRAGVIEKLPGFGAKSAEKFRTGLAFLKRVSGRRLRHHACRVADALRALFSSLPGVQEILFAGSLRRGCETIGDLDVVIVASMSDQAALREHMGKLPEMEWGETGTVWRGRCYDFPVEVTFTSREMAALHLLRATGSQAHIAALFRAAAERGVVLEEITKAPDGSPAGEATLYHALGFEFVPPALREDEHTLVPLGHGAFPPPVTEHDVRGILHVHTPASDGRSTLRELARVMIERGYEYLGIADHSQTAAYAHGLSPARVREQWKEIDELNSELAPFRILKGIEADILPDGRPDYDDELLAGFDFVIASVHSGFRMTEREATTRLCRALAHPHVDILGHPTGRLLLQRDGYPVDHEEVIACAAKHGKGIELNCNPHRLDLDWRHISRCMEHNVPVALCPDAHDCDGLWDIRYGLDVAAKGPLTAPACPNTWPAETFLEWCASHGA